VSCRVVLHVRRGTHQQSGRRGEQGATSVRAYFPGELWYDYFTHAPATNGKATWLTLRAPLDTIPVRCRWLRFHFPPLEPSTCVRVAP
jgi:hypothetical protein